jgi:hypothetical protein
MTIRIKAPRAWTRKEYIGAFFKKRDSNESAVRIVREADWKRLMKLVRLVEVFNGSADVTWDEIEAALDALKGAK